MQILSGHSEGVTHLSPDRTNVLGQKHPVYRGTYVIHEPQEYNCQNVAGGGCVVLMLCMIAMVVVEQAREKSRITFATHLVHIGLNIVEVYPDCHMWMDR